MKKHVATQFGISLDQDDFATTRELLSVDCKYIIGNETLIGPENISNSYETNMIEGRKKLDQLEWGQSTIEVISNNEFFVHFTDYLTHKEAHYTHRCKQKLTVNSENKIIKIEHIDDQGEQERLNAFYTKVGLR